MKTTFTLLLLAVFALGVNAQTLPEGFETAESDTAWHQFANSGDLPENMFLVENPVTDGINPSATCLQLNVLETADPWVGAWAEAYGEITISTDRYMLEMMVLKDVISNCAMKLEAGDGPNTELKIPNTLIDEWELLTFDMSAAMGYTYPRLVIFPDFPDTRETGSTCLIDNIHFAFPVSVEDQRLAGISIYPNPAAERMTIRYPDMEGALISNVLGQTVKSLTFQQSSLEHIDLADLEPGLYFITVESAGKTVSSKFIRE
jgi:hypothetical protein